MSEEKKLESFEFQLTIKEIAGLFKEPDDFITECERMFAQDIQSQDVKNAYKQAINEAVAQRGERPFFDCPAFINIVIYRPNKMEMPQTCEHIWQHTRRGLQRHVGSDRYGIVRDDPCDAFTGHKVTYKIDRDNPRIVITVYSEEM